MEMLKEVRSVKGNIYTAQINLINNVLEIRLMNKEGNLYSLSTLINKVDAVKDIQHWIRVAIDEVENSSESVRHQIEEWNGIL